MRLLTVTSIVALVVSIAVLVFVLGLYAELEKSGSKAHTQELNHQMVSDLMADHVNELIKASDITMESDEGDWVALPGNGCFWNRSSIESLFPYIYEPGGSIGSMTLNYIGTRDIWLMTCTNYSSDSLTTWYMDDNTGEVTYGRPDYDLYESGRTTDSSGSQPPTSEDICASAQRLINILAGDAALEIRTEVFKTQLAHGCYK
mgnify:CR=1 FL=1